MTAAGGLAAMSGPVEAAETHADAKPNHVTISDDTAFLARYRPLLDMRNIPRDNRPTLYGWKATSPEHSTDAAVFCCEYAVQKDILTLTSHAGDHEWIYVFVDDDSGTVTEVAYTAYHWLRGYVTSPPVFGGEGEDHPAFLIAPTYHNYSPMSEDTRSSVLLDPRSLGDYATRSGPFYRWLANGMSEDLAKGAVHNPWLLDSDGPLEAWWSREGSGRVNNAIVNAWAFVAFGFGVGIRGAENADPGEADL